MHYGDSLALRVLWGEGLSCEIKDTELSKFDKVTF